MLKSPSTNTLEKQLPKTYMGDQIVDKHRGFNTMFIYCNVLDSRVVGDATTSLLATLPNSNRRMLFGDMVTNRFAKIRYYPVAKRYFHTIRIDVHTDVSQPVGFKDGKVFVELHFRKVISA